MNTMTCSKAPVTIDLTESEIKRRLHKIFDKAKHQNECLVKIYEIVFPDWNRIDRIHGFPVVGCELWKYICKLFIEFDKIHHPECFNSGIWINNGFSSSADLDDWEISLERCKVTYF